MRGGRGLRAADHAGECDALARAVALSGLELSAEAVEAASRTALAITAIASMGFALACAFILDLGRLFALPVLVILAPILAYEAVRGYPARLAGRRAEAILRDSMRGTNLMIMSLRHEPSLPKAIQFASKGRSAFAHELRTCIWNVVMAKHASFEETVQELGDRWGSRSLELKASLDALVTASCEATEEGKRRALDRANNAMVAGAKHRIEEYAMSLSAPSMIMFGLGILLPIMVGSFLPMLSWDLWSMDEIGEEPDLIGSGRTTLQTLFVMNILFPAVALFVAVSTAARHPLEGRTGRDRRKSGWRLVAAVAAVSASSACLSAWLLDGQLRAAALLLSATAPVSVLLMARGREPAEKRLAGAALGLEDALFRAGARMTEGENLETALSRTAAGMSGPGGERMRTRVLRAMASGWDGDGPRGDSECLESDGNALDGLRVVQTAASKNEGAAGILAMDLAAYLKDLRDLDRTLRMRLRPTVSMMKMTSYALSPIVLGVTFAIYLSLGEIAGAGLGSGGADAFFLVLGFFLAETNAVVMYFVWSIEGGRGKGELLRSVGTCLLCSEGIYTATSLVVSG